MGGDGDRKTAFSNGTMFDIWSASWCDRCLRDAPFRNMGKGSGCPILLKVLCDNEVPPEWLIQDAVLGDYHCIEFRAPGDGGGEPRPKPPPQGDPGLFPEPERGVRMLVQPSPVEVSA